MACHCQPRRLTAYSYWCYLSGGVLLLSSFVVGAAPDGGWFMYVPLTSREFSLGMNQDFRLLGVTFDQDMHARRSASRASSPWVCGGVRCGADWSVAHGMALGDSDVSAP